MRRLQIINNFWVAFNIPLKNTVQSGVVVAHICLRGQATGYPGAEGCTVLTYPSTVSNNPSRRLVPWGTSIPGGPAECLLGVLGPLVRGHRVTPLLLSSPHQPADPKPLHYFSCGVG